MSVRKTLCRVAAIPDGGALAIDIADDGNTRSILLLRSGDRVSAYENECPHAARRLDWAPGQFLVEDGYLICAAHGAMFTIPAGECVAGPCRGEHLLAVATTLVDGNVDLVEG
jgi:nitrite reductase/ring-hydroxylating ferredoxin subunit